MAASRFDNITEEKALPAAPFLRFYWRIGSTGNEDQVLLKQKHFETRQTEAARVRYLP